MDGPHLRVLLRPSTLQWHLLRWLHAAAAIAVLCNQLAPAWRAALLLLVLASLLRESRRHRAAGERLLCCDGERWRLAENGELTDVTLLPDSRVLLHTVVVRLRVPGQRLPRTLLLFRDAASADELRRLRTCLRLGKGLAEPAQASQPFA